MPNTVHAAVKLARKAVAAIEAGQVQHLRDPAFVQQVRDACPARRATWANLRGMAMEVLRDWQAGPFAHPHAQTVRWLRQVAEGKRNGPPMPVN